MSVSNERRARFTYATGDLEPLGLMIPDNLKEVISNAPKGDRAKGEYLKRLVDDGTITTDDVTFLIESGALID